MAYYKLKSKPSLRIEKRVNENKKKYKYIYKRVTDMTVIKTAYQKMRKGKTNRKGIQHIDANLDYYCQKMKRMLENTRPEGVTVEHPELAFYPHKHEEIDIFEKKKRKVQKPSLTEQWVHHIILQVLQPIFFKRLYRYSLGSIPKRKYGKYMERNGGAHKGKKKLEYWIHGGFKFFIKADIRHFYDSVRVDKMLETLSGYICDSWMVHLISLCFVHNRRGIPLGFYISQWCANMFLEKLDNLIIESGFRHLRYMDDIIIVGNNKKALHQLIVKIKQTLGKMRLKIKGNWQVCRFDYVKKDRKRIGRPVDFMGFKFYRDKTVLRKHILRGMNRIARHIARRKAQGKKICCHQASSIVSRMGWIKHTDCYGWYLRHIKPLVEIRQMKGIVSKRSKKERQHDGKVRREAIAA